MASTEQTQLTNGFAPAPGTVDTQQRTVSRDYSNTPEWDASKTPPSRFQKRKGSIYATPPSRDGHVERNRDAVEEFHRAHSKRWSIASSSSSTGKSPSQGGAAAAADGQQQQQQQRKSSVNAQ